MPRPAHQNGFGRVCCGGTPLLATRQIARPALQRLLYRGGPIAAKERNGGQITRRGRLEAVLFVAREPLPVRKLAQLANLADGTEVRSLLGELRSMYDQRGCAFQVEQVAGGYQLLTRSKFAPWLRPVAGTAEEIRLSGPALETLAVVAYRQPVLRSEVEAIRGVNCGEILRQLLDRDLLRIVGRSEELGRPLWYATTRRFLQTFGMSQLDELPWATTLRRKPATGRPQGDHANASVESLPPRLTDGVDAA